MPAWVCLTNEADESVMPRQQFFEWEMEAMCDEVARLLSSDGILSGQMVQPSDIAIIVKSRREMSLFHEALKRRGVHCAMQDRTDVFSTEEATDFLEWLVAMAHCRQSGHVRRFMLNPLSGLGGYQPDHEVRLNEASPVFQTIQQQLMGWRDEFLQQGCLGVFYRLLDENRLGGCTEQHGNRGRALTNWLHLAELVTQAMATRSNFSELIAWFESCVNDVDSDGASEYLQRLESDQNLVSIMTIHGSKGLEFPIVFLPRLLTLFEKPEAERWVWDFYDAKQGATCVTLHPAPSDEVMAASSHESEAELIRQVYVAVTRASVRNYVGWGCFKDWQKSVLCQLMALPEECKDNWRWPMDEWCALSGGFFECVAVDENFASMNSGKPESMSVSQSGMLRAQLFEGSVASSFSVHSFSGLAPAHSAPHVPLLPSDGRLESELSDWCLQNFPKGAHVGNLVHGLLEWMAACSDKIDSVEFDQAIDEHIARAGIDIHWMETLKRWLLCIWQAPIHESGWSLASLDARDRKVEMEFYCPLATDAGRIQSIVRQFGYPCERLRVQELQGYMRGFIDLIVHHEGRFYIIDYKTNDLGVPLNEYSSSLMKSAVFDHHYHLQYLFYAVAVHRYLQRVVPNYEYNSHFGDVRYLFVRGVGLGDESASGIYVDRPSYECIVELSRAFGEVCV